MARPTHVHVDTQALLHNIDCIKKIAQHKKIIAMVKANAYGCGLPAILPTLEKNVDFLGVACLEEALAVRKLGSRAQCILFQGIFCADELNEVVEHNFEIVIHHVQQLEWLLATRLPKRVKIWVKVDTGMHRLGLPPEKVYEAIQSLQNCAWVDNNLGILTHLACADEPIHSANQQQLEIFNNLKVPEVKLTRSIANSAAILSLPEAHADVVRPGIMLYGISPFAGQTGKDLGLKPVLHLVSEVTAINPYPPHSPIGYGRTWESDKPSIVGIIPVGYGDGFPRHIKPGTKIWINDTYVPIIGRVSMDVLTVDLTDAQHIQVGDPVELWGLHTPIESIAESAGTIAYELLSQLTPRVRK
ncbi:alanine racemase (plasmid) [Legionella adelaidensis]|uniref:Alanine racemase n=1 Tax=Legionella adelaidensis TaxID=45056 RepID=A0A0W0R3X8_9GAMM|nr:alanine racemase [Legionella adelaidensis]KTC65791.1 alanine racemase [Legionella adelaidensis]VEH85219.1 alanine racemase [Legionella adelaidensis]